MTFQGTMMDMATSVLSRGGIRNRNGAFELGRLWASLIVARAVTCVTTYAVGSQFAIPMRRLTGKPAGMAVSTLGRCRCIARGWPHRQPAAETASNEARVAEPIDNRIG